MASTAHSDPEQIKERYDPPEVLEKKIDQLADLVRNSNHFVVFTGAGISTDAGIPDFRGPEGAWTLKAQGRMRTTKTVSTFKAIPTATHMAIKTLQDKEMCHYLISQNCDGLHRRSGIEPEKISELHGNSNIEYCEDCKHEYLRDFRCVRINRYVSRDSPTYQADCHFTGRRCVAPGKGKKVCNGRLLNSTIDFGQNLPEVPLAKADQHSRQADLHLVLGSSLTVSPANSFPKKTSKHGDLVICNLQNTHLDNRCTLRIYARCDTVMKGLMSRLAIPLPQWNLHRKVQVTVKKEESGMRLVCQGAERGTQGQMIPASIVRQARAVGLGKKKEKLVLTAENGMTMMSRDDEGFAVAMDFFGHYKESSFAFEVPGGELSFVISLWFNPKIENEWHFSVDSKDMTLLSPDQFEKRWA
uniref:protein acetyllysine N-acetyltransferase n=1 Tax=Paramoeba aestuarina TaxID=180227 RepID=A0A7S4NFL9_9EUKA|mmetsp:Transcript_16032/g.24972  ORF Transcript_16032/g.24972 Transcript_16032/m.24972 type:complete len:414 (+) Transcript_16032:120-1361(+)|eukprot:CAMPEP_0201538786 /NCGR_PEP_ID=MMETSP0161_2-20130828/68595_1 /ASSEMBLY_ACC=CAM_ASM_000251 /TAXON_ID=180227 /ORGANISM="Neoparamoeba aestuarina, Strain SoJaBio B1-5/56/2" /LENGTH=413 /DNA_ID=CAMNT_0047945829 /DNA_START=51 /DNA_END=1292 /DNA_ORIENTATION=-